MLDDHDLGEGGIGPSLMRKVREASPADRARVSASLAAAFQDDPVMAYAFPDAATRRRRLPGVFALLFDADGAHGARFMTADAAAATLWQAPGARHMSLLDKARELPAWLGASGPAILRLLAYSDASDANRPAAPHWYLHIAGCAPAAQGGGLGRAVIRAGLDLADRDGVAAYLETSTERNLGYYQALGFAVTHEWVVRRRLRCWSMLRPAGG